MLQNLADPPVHRHGGLKPHLAGITAIVLVEQLVGGFGMAAHRVPHATLPASLFGVALCDRDRRRVAGSTLSGYASGPLNERLGHPLFFTVAFFASIPSLVLVLLVPKTSIERTRKTLAERRSLARGGYRTSDHVRTATPDPPLGVQ